MVDLSSRVAKNPHSPEALRNKAIKQFAGYMAGNIAMTAISALPMMLAGITADESLNAIATLSMEDI